MKLVHAGFDSVYVALQGALPQPALELLASAKKEAGVRQEPVLAHLGDGVAVHLHPGGRSGGYAFQLDTGPLGEVMAFKENTDAREWNGFVSFKAATLAAMGYHAAREQAVERLSAMGFCLTGCSVNRVDCAMDFLSRGFELRLDGFVASPRSKVRPHWESNSTCGENQPAAVFRGRSLESVTIGKMPGRQIIVYDKRKEAISRRKEFWFPLWGIDRNDSDAQVWRVELRAGKRELKDRWGIRSFEDVDRSIADVFRAAVLDVRYVSEQQTDSNVTRQLLDPLWQKVVLHIENGMAEFRSGLLPSAVRDCERAAAQTVYRQLALGNLAGYAVALGLSDAEIEVDLPNIVRALTRDALKNRSGKFLAGVARARERLHFVA